MMTGGINNESLIAVVCVYLSEKKNRKSDVQFREKIEIRDRARR